MTGGPLFSPVRPLYIGYSFYKGRCWSLCLMVCGHIALYQCSLGGVRTETTKGSPGYISARAMTTCLAALPGLISLSIGFRSPLSRPPQLSPPPLMRTDLPAGPALADLHLSSGVGEYFKDSVARIDTPLLNRLFVMFFMGLIFDIP